MKILSLILIGILVLAPLAMAVETSGPEYSSPNGHADWLADGLNSQDCITHDHDVYIDNPRNPIEAYLGIEYHASKSWLIGARVLCDINNADRHDIEDNLRAEFGATFRFGPGLE